MFCYCDQKGVPVMGNLLDKAITIAVNAHSGQVDKAGSDYILHPLRVMLKLKTEEEQVVGVMHDVLEDTEVTFETLRETGFSYEIIDALQSVTRMKGEDYFDFVLRAKSNRIGKPVKLADLEDNMDMSRIQNPTSTDYKRLGKYRKANRLLLNE
jgi:(p)ppGpp synthase/HD superfamily hydrolase